MYRYNEADLKAEEAEKRVQKLEQELADKEQYNEELQEKYRGIKSELDELSRQFEELSTYVSLVTRFYLILFERIIDGKPLAGGKAYYTTVDGEVVMGEYSDKLAQYLYEFGILKSPAVNELSQEELAKVSQDSFHFGISAHSMFSGPLSA